MSHGDQLSDPTEAATHLVDDPTFAGGFSLAGETISTAPVSDSHHQSTSVTPPGGGYVVTAQDGLSDGAFSCTDCSTRFGEWSSVDVDHGNLVGGLIQVTLVIAQDQLPAGFTGDDLGSVELVHVFDAGHDPAQEILSTRCGDQPAAGCITPTLLPSGNLQIVAYVTQNGGFKGML